LAYREHNVRDDLLTTDEMDGPAAEPEAGNHPG